MTTSSSSHCTPPSATGSPRARHYQGADHDPDDDTDISPVSFSLFDLVAKGCCTAVTSIDLLQDVRDDSPFDEGVELWTKKSGKASAAANGNVVTDGDDNSSESSEGSMDYSAESKDGQQQLASSSPKGQAKNRNHPSPSSLTRKAQFKSRLNDYRTGIEEDTTFDNLGDVDYNKTTIVVVSAFKERSDAPVGIVFTHLKKKKKKTDVAIIARVLPTSIFSTHSLEGSIVRQVNEVSVSNPRHAAELVYGAAVGDLYLTVEVPHQQPKHEPQNSPKREIEIQLLKHEERMSQQQLARKKRQQEQGDETNEKEEEGSNDPRIGEYDSDTSLGEGDKQDKSKDEEYWSAFNVIENAFPQSNDKKKSGLETSKEAANKKNANAVVRSKKDKKSSGRAAAASTKKKKKKHQVQAAVPVTFSVPVSDDIVNSDGVSDTESVSSEHGSTHPLLRSKDSSDVEDVVDDDDDDEEEEAASSSASDFSVPVSDDIVNSDGVSDTESVSSEHGSTHPLLRSKDSSDVEDVVDDDDDDEEEEAPTSPSSAAKKPKKKTMGMSFKRRIAAFGSSKKNNIVAAKGDVPDDDNNKKLNLDDTNVVSALDIMNDLNSFNSSMNDKESKGEDESTEEEASDDNDDVSPTTKQHDADANAVLPTEEEDASSLLLQDMLFATERVSTFMVDSVVNNLSYGYEESVLKTTEDAVFVHEQPQSEQGEDEDEESAEEEAIQELTDEKNDDDDVNPPETVSSAKEIDTAQVKKKSFLKRAFLKKSKKPSVKKEDAVFVREQSQIEEESEQGKGEDEEATEEEATQELANQEIGNDNDDVNPPETISTTEEIDLVKKKSFLKRPFLKKSKKPSVKKEDDLEESKLVSKVDSDDALKGQNEVGREEATVDKTIELSYDSMAKNMEAVFPSQIEEENDEDEGEATAEKSTEGKAVQGTSTTDIASDTNDNDVNQPSTVGKAVQGASTPDIASDTNDNDVNQPGQACAETSPKACCAEKKKKSFFTFKKKSKKQNELEDAIIVPKVDEEAEKDQDGKDSIPKEDQVDDTSRIGNLVNVTSAGVEVHTPSKRGGLLTCALSPISVMSPTDIVLESTGDFTARTGSNNDASASCSLTDESNTITFTATPPHSHLRPKTPLTPTKSIGSNNDSSASCSLSDESNSKLPIAVNANAFAAISIAIFDIAVITVPLSLPAMAMTIYRSNLMQFEIIAAQNFLVKTGDSFPASPTFLDILVAPGSTLLHPTSKQRVLWLLRLHRSYSALYDVVYDLFSIVNGTSKDKEYNAGIGSSDLIDAETSPKAGRAEKKKKSFFTFKKKSKKQNELEDAIIVPKVEKAEKDQDGKDSIPKEDQDDDTSHIGNLANVTSAGVEVHTPSKRGGLLTCALSPISVMSPTDIVLESTGDFTARTGSNNDATASCSLTDESNTITFTATPPHSHLRPKTPLTPTKSIGSNNDSSASCSLSDESNSKLPIAVNANAFAAISIAIFDIAVITVPLSLPAMAMTIYRSNLMQFEIIAAQNFLVKTGDSFPASPTFLDILVAPGSTLLHPTSKQRVLWLLRLHRSYSALYDVVYDLFSIVNGTSKDKEYNAGIGSSDLIDDVCGINSRDCTRPYLGCIRFIEYDTKSFKKKSKKQNELEDAIIVPKVEKAEKDQDGKDSIPKEDQDDDTSHIGNLANVTSAGVEVHTPSKRGGLLTCALSPISVMSPTDIVLESIGDFTARTGSNNDATASCSLTDESNTITFTATPPHSHLRPETPLTPTKIGESWNVVGSFLFGLAEPPSPCDSEHFRSTPVCSSAASTERSRSPTTTVATKEDTHDSMDEPLTFECKLLQDTSSSTGKKQSVNVSMERLADIGEKQGVGNNNKGSPRRLPQTPPSVNRKLNFDSNNFRDSLCKASFQSRAIEDVTTVYLEDDCNNSLLGTSSKEKNNSNLEDEIEELAQAKQHAFDIVKRSGSIGRYYASKGQQQKFSQRVGSLKFLRNNRSKGGGQGSSEVQEANMNEASMLLGL
eukprot:CAMPEP_0172328082 /NCGR_PEP_ID=MMETSP1058-20130122/60159_1 /TAXON_ID=83371 /ORGANISM="Detonula confervacea, Strain CCMP 353" /LENGTH=2000 /DNA_ID=CAMNT_0013045179 /DNA_START=107 /DNA_END=6121 /DNA_ORIENTATION=-